MGGINDKQSVIGYDAYTQWTLPCVERAYERAKACHLRHQQLRSTQALSKGENKHGHLLPLRRFDFWEVFTDYGHITENGTFLRLEIETFNNFAVDTTTGDPIEAVDAVELCLVLALFCKKESNADEHAAPGLELCFNMMDADRSGSLERPEMEVLMRKLDSMAFKVGMTPRMASQEELLQLTDDMFREADQDGNNDVSCEEFINWALKNMASAQLIDQFERLRMQADALKQQEAKAAQKRLRAERRAMQRRMRLAGEDPAQKARIEARNKNRVATRHVLRQLSQSTPFSVAELAELRTKFSSQVEGRSDASLTRSQFTAIMCETFPSLVSMKAGGISAVDLLFNAFDLDGDRTIDFKEFTLGCAKLIKGTMTEKMDLIFEVCDADGDGTLDMAEIVALLEKEKTELQDASQFTQQVVQTLDKNQDGSVSRDEFSKVLHDNPLLYEIFAKNIMPGLDDVKLQYKSLQNKFPTELAEYDVKYLTKLYNKYFASGEKPNELSITEFRLMMINEFHVPPVLLPVVNRLFHVFDDDNSGKVSWKELFKGLAQTLTGTVQDRAAMYFAVYDTDGSGELSTDEIMHMVMSSQEAVEDGAVEVKRILDQLDQDGNGSVSLQEFKDAAVTNPKMLESFGRLFGIADEYGDDDDDTDLTYLGVEKDKVVELERLLAGDDGGAKGRSHLMPGCDRHVGLQRLRKLSLKTLGNVMRVWQNKQDDFGSLKVELQDESDSSKLTRRQRRNKAKAARLARRKQKRAANRAAAHAAIDGDEPGAATARSGATTTRSSAGAGTGAGAGAGAGLGAGTLSLDVGSEASGSTPTEELEAEASAAATAPAAVAAADKAKYSHHDYLECHASLAAKWHGRLLAQDELPKMKQALKKDMHKASAEMREHIESLDPTNGLYFLTHGTPGTKRPKPLHQEYELGMQTPFPHITQHAMDAEHAMQSFRFSPSRHNLLSAAGSFRLDDSLVSEDGAAASPLTASASTGGVAMSRAASKHGLRTKGSKRSMGNTLGSKRTMGNTLGSKRTMGSTLGSKLGSKHSMRLSKTGSKASMSLTRTGSKASMSATHHGERHHVQHEDDHDAAPRFKAKQLLSHNPYATRRKHEAPKELKQAGAGASSKVHLRVTLDADGMESIEVSQDGNDAPAGSLGLAGSVKPGSRRRLSRGASATRRRKSHGSSARAATSGTRPASRSGRLSPERSPVTAVRIGARATSAGRVEDGADHRLRPASRRSVSPARQPSRKSLPVLHKAQQATAEEPAAAAAAGTDSDATATPAKAKPRSLLLRNGHGSTKVAADALLRQPKNLDAALESHFQRQNARAHGPSRRAGGTTIQGRKELVTKTPSRLRMSAKHLSGRKVLNARSLRT